MPHCAARRGLIQCTEEEGMAKVRELPKDWRKQLREEGTKEVAQLYQALLTETEAIPSRAKTQYPTYIEVKTLHLLRGVATIKRISVQELIRECIREGLESRMTVPKRTKGGGGAKKRGVSKKKKT